MRLLLRRCHLAINPAFFTSHRSKRLLSNLSVKPFAVNHATVSATKATLLGSMPIPFLSALFSTANTQKMEFPDKRPEQEWRTVLSPQQFRVLREKETERPGTGEYDKHMPSSGTYQCAGCGTPLYKASHKFSADCGWPAYFDSIPGAITRIEDKSFGMVRTEIVCSHCGGHLGHVFKGENYPTPTNERHCVNSISLKFTEDENTNNTTRTGEA